MKYVKSLIAIFVIALITVTCFCTKNLKAAWHYAMSVSDSINVPMSVEVFPWVGADQLPGDIVGEDHQALIEAILNGTYTESNGKITQIGLNNPNSYISNEIQNRTISINSSIQVHPVCLSCYISRKDRERPIIYILPVLIWGTILPIFLWEKPCTLCTVRNCI